MSLTPQEASAQLHEAESAARRSARAYGYHQASPMLLIWGVIWVLGYAGMDLVPRQSDALWPALCLIGTLLSFLLIRRNETPDAAGRQQALRIVGLIVVFLAFFYSAYAILGPLTQAQYIAFPPLLVGMAYTGLGFWMGARMIATGLAIFALTLVGYFTLTQHYALFMGVVGGGALILAGLWFRRV